MANKFNSSGKIKILKEHKTLNPQPDKIEDEIFKTHEFFDANDMLQVKYEMLRRVQVEGWNVAKASKIFGFSRPSFYKAQKNFQEGGLSGLLPQEGGPKGPHKLSDEVMDFVEQSISEDESLRAPKIVILIQKKFDIEVHPRSIERALARRKKKAKSN